MKTIASMLAVLLLATAAWADRTPTARLNGTRDPGVRGDITVPYLTTGYTAFGAYYVAPRVYSAPTMDDLRNPGARPAYNLPFYGARMGYGDFMNGYVPKPTLLPSQAK
jgi:hypothetical protein